MNKVITGKVRLSYVALAAPKADLEGSLKYSVTILLPKSDVQTKAAIDRAIAQATEDGRTGKWNGIVPPVVKNPIWDGDGIKQDGSPFGDECKGHWVFTASTKADPAKPRPEVVDANLQPILDASQIYSGMYGRVSVTFAPYLFSGSKGVGCYLNHVQKLEDGEPLAGSKASAMDDFGAGQAPMQQAPMQQYQQAPMQQAPMQQAPANWSANQGLEIDPFTGLPVAPGGVMGL